MALPGHRRTSSHKRRRASHFALKPANLPECPKCREPKQQHRACPGCGTYSGRQVLKMDSPLEKKAPAKKAAPKKKADQKKK